MKWRCDVCGTVTRRRDTVGEVVLCKDRECHKTAWRWVTLAAERAWKKTDGKSKN